MNSKTAKNSGPGLLAQAWGALSILSLLFVAYYSRILIGFAFVAPSILTNPDILFSRLSRDEFIGLGLITALLANWAVFNLCYIVQFSRTGYVLRRRYDREHSGRAPS